MRQTSLIDSLTGPDRITEIADILALGLQRLNARKSSLISPEVEILRSTSSRGRTVMSRVNAKDIGT
jgi:hypothetical protein